ncbi:hypothetical protein TorRG33x02_107670 [Trema orientale]|uniref:Uncharacterized protein n=1 Tax=Trema orientale TaxID=63057 RepID=A0A2P5F6U4_TREOI|nr:hypothetical protein TorRG33x02_107670 [Trema orientale]
MRAASKDVGGIDVGIVHSELRNAVVVPPIEQFIRKLLMPISMILTFSLSQTANATGANGAAI